MSDFVIRNLAELGDRESAQAAEIFVEGFYDSLRYFTSDRDKLARALVHALCFGERAVFCRLGGGTGSGDLRVFRRTEAGFPISTG